MTKRLINALKSTAKALNNGHPYEWGHMGRCNVGCLVQNLTGKTDVEIAKTVDFELEEWSEYANEYCNRTSVKFDDLFLNLYNEGLGYKDVIHLEYLSDPGVLDLMPSKNLKRNNPQDVSSYMMAYAHKLESAKPTH